MGARRDHDFNPGFHGYNASALPLIYSTISTHTYLILPGGTRGRHHILLTSRYIS